MRAFHFTEQHHLTPIELPLPRCQPGEVLIEVKAIGINRADLFQRQGLYPLPTGKVKIPGLEVAGTIIECGENVVTLQKGMAVCALLSEGGYANYVSVPESQVLPLPHGFSYIQGAALPEALATVWYNLAEQVALSPEKTVLIHGGASGIGTFAIQYAKSKGAKVIATARTVSKREACQRLGADLVCNYQEKEWVEEVLNFCQGVDITLDMLGGNYLAQNIQCLKEKGTLLVIAVLNGKEGTLPLGKLLVKNLTLRGTTLRQCSLAVKAHILAKLRQEVWPLLEKRVIIPQIDRVFPWENIQDAHQYMEQNVHIGKIVLTVGSPTP